MRQVVMTDEETPNMSLALAALFAAVVVLGTVDIVLDVREQGATAHIVLELVLAALAEARPPPGGRGPGGGRCGAGARRPVGRDRGAVRGVGAHRCRARHRAR